MAGAIDVLPAMPLGSEPEVTDVNVTGIEAQTLVPMLVPTSGNDNAVLSIPDNLVMHFTLVHIWATFAWYG